MDEIKLQAIIEGALFAAGKALSIKQLLNLFEEHEQPQATAIKEALSSIKAGHEKSAIELQDNAGHYSFQVKADYAPWVSRLFEEKPARYSRALLETLAIIAYRQPVTRAEIETIRGVTVSTATMKTLLDHEWVRLVGHRDVPGKPALYATSRQFLEHFNLGSLDALPTLSELRDKETLEQLLDKDSASNDGASSALFDSIVQLELESVTADTEETDSIISEPEETLEQPND